VQTPTGSPLRTAWTTWRVHNRRGPLTLRWIYAHMIEELARHAGHGDILKEQIVAADEPTNEAYAGAGRARRCTLLALLAEEGEVLHRLTACIAEPVRHPRVELGRLSTTQHEVVLSEDQSQTTGQDVQPLMTLMGTGIRFSGRPCGQDHLVRLQRAGLLGQRHHRHAMQGAWFQMDTRVASGRGTHQLVESDAVCPRQRQQQLQVRAALSGLQPRQRADRDARGLRQLSQGDLALPAQRPKPRSYSTDDLVDIRCALLAFCHVSKATCHRDGAFHSGRWPPS
jgi:hypothetical protein